MFNSQILLSALYGVMFSDNPDGAFAAYRFLEAVGLAIGFVYNSVLCTDVKLFIMIAVHVSGSLLYYVAEMQQKQLDESLKEDEDYDSNEVHHLKHIRASLDDICTSM